MLITKVDIDDRGILCFQFDNDEWVAVTQYRWLTEEQRRLIEEHPEFEGWTDEAEDEDETLRRDENEVDGLIERLTRRGAAVRERREALRA